MHREILDILERPLSKTFWSFNLHDFQKKKLFKQNTGSEMTLLAFVRKVYYCILALFDIQVTLHRCFSLLFLNDASGVFSFNLFALFSLCVRCFCLRPILKHSIFDANANSIKLKSPSANNAKSKQHTTFGIHTRGHPKGKYTTENY